jgi:aryl-alcohol dehydrogenase-like predicted oxidoreductase
VELRKLGKSGLKVSKVGLGCNNFGGRVDLEGTRAVVHQALDSGITLFDTADIYGNRGGSESLLGEVLGDRRKEIVLATKFGGGMSDSKYDGGASRRHVLNAAEASLKRLKTDWIDLYQLHFPDEDTPIEETLSALDSLVQSGKVRYIGCSNVPAWMVVDSIWLSRLKGWSAFVSYQDEYSLVVRTPEKELIPMAREFGLGLLPYFPLASGLLTGKYKQGEAMPEGARLTVSKGMADRYMTEKNWAIVGGLSKFAEDHGHSLLELAFSWLAAQPTVSSVIAGATKPEQAATNATAADWELTAGDLDEVKKILEA